MCRFSSLKHWGVAFQQPSGGAVSHSACMTDAGKIPKAYTRGIMQWSISNQAGYASLKPWHRAEWEMIFPSNETFQDFKTSLVVGALIWDVEMPGSELWSAVFSHPRRVP